MLNQEPSFPEASKETRMAFFSKRAGSRLFTVKYLLDFKCNNWNQEIKKISNRPVFQNSLKEWFQNGKNSYKNVLARKFKYVYC